MIPITESPDPDPDNSHRSSLSMGSNLLRPIGEKGGGYTAKMSANCQSLRLVVQHVWESSSGRSSYRLIGYSDEHTYRPVDFGSVDELLEVFSAALSGLDVSSFPRARQPVSSILFAEVVELSETQRSTLGLKT